MMRLLACMGASQYLRCMDGPDATKLVDILCFLHVTEVVNPPDSTATPENSRILLDSFPARFTKALLGLQIEFVR